MQDNTIQMALLYCRVSDPKQKTHGSGLTSQEHRCRQYANEHGYIVEKVFADDITGGGSFFKRPKMTELLQYLQDHQNKKYIIIFDDLKRFARDTRFHFDLRDTLREFGAEVECLNYKFDYTPEGEFVETVFAAQNTLERKQNQRQTIQKMKARKEQGFWQFRQPRGYKFELVRGQGKILFPDEPVASIIKEGLEGYASGRFQTKAEVQRFFQAQPNFPKGFTGRVPDQHVHDILSNILYAAYFKYKPWGIGLTKAQHEPLISYETHVTILKRLKGRAHAPARKNINEDFPLRGFVLCTCDHPMTDCWSKGSTKLHPYYFCQNKGCEHYKKSIRREYIEGDFEDILQQITPKPQMVSIWRKRFTALWNNHRKFELAGKQAMKDKLRSIDREITKLVDRIVQTDVNAAIKACEDRISVLEDEKIILNEKIEKNGEPKRSFDETYRTAMEFLANPFKLWASGRIDHRHTVLKLAFGDKLMYERGKGYRTAKTTLPFRHLGDFCTSNSKMVAPDGETSNAIVEELVELNDYLENHVPYYQDEYQGPEL